MASSDPLSDFTLGIDDILKTTEAPATATSITPNHSLPLETGNLLDQSESELPLPEADVDLLGSGSPSPGPLYGMTSANAPFEEQSLLENSPEVSSVEATGPLADGAGTSEPAGGPGLGSHDAHSQGPSTSASASNLQEGLVSMPGDSVDDQPIKVVIKEPEKHETVTALGIKSHYITYLIRTDCTLPGMRADGMEVRRRFSDFDALYKVLRSEFRGCFVPPLPEKSFIDGRIGRDEFIRVRRADLQAFIRCVTLHPVLRDSEALKIFLLQPGELGRNPAWLAITAPTPSMRAMRAGSGGDASSQLLPGSAAPGSPAAPITASALKAQVGNWVSWMRQSVTTALTPPKRELSEEEVVLRQRKELLQDLARLLELSVESARRMCTHMDAVSEDVKEMGRNFAMLSRFEEAVQGRVGQYTQAGASAAARAADLNKVAYGSVKQHPVWKTLSLKTAASLVTLHDYMVLIPEAVAALEEREHALSHLHALEEDLAAKKAALEQAQAQANSGRARAALNPSGVSAAEKRAYQLTQAIGALEEQIKGAQAEYDLIKERNQSDLARLDTEREADFRTMMATYAQTQAGLVQASADMWMTLARQFSE